MTMQAATKLLPRSTLPWVLAGVLCAGALSAGAALAGEPGRNGGAITLLGTIAVPTSLKPLHGWDISWLDADTQLLYVADRSNRSVDVFNASTNTFVRAITGGSTPFAGVAFNPATGAADNGRSGPNGVVVSGHWLFVTDANSRVVSIDLRTDQIVPGGDVSTGGADALRADELAYDPDHGVLLVANNADDPPFVTLIKVNRTNGQLTVGARIAFDPANNGFDATNGAEQPQYHRGKFYLSIPEVDCPRKIGNPPVDNPVCGGSFADGGVVTIDPNSSGKIEKLSHVKFCQPAGLTVGPNDDLLIGCSQAFDTAGNAWTASDPHTAAPISVIMDANTGAIDTMVAGVSGNDEVWFNRGDGRYYLAARNQPGGPVVGVIDAESQSLVQVVPTLNVGGKSCTLNPLNCSAAFPAGTAHSLAVDPHSNHVLVPLAANNVFPQCLNGCVAVYGTPRGEHDDEE